MRFFDCCRDRWADFHPLWRGLIVVAVVAGIGLAAGPPSLGIYRGWHTDRQFAAAVEAAELRRYAEARELSIEVLRRDPSRTEVLPILLRATDALHDPSRSQVAREILRSDGMFSRRERLAAWESTCRSSPTWRVLSTWRAVLGAEKHHPAFVSALFDRMHRDGMIEDASSLLQEQPQPLPPELHLRLMRLFLHIGSDQVFEEFQKNFTSRISSHHDGVETLIPLLDLLPQASLLPATYAALSAWQETQGPPDAAASLRLARYQMAAHPERADAIFAAALDHHRAEDPITTIRWCVLARRLEEARQLLELLPPSDDPEVFELRCLVYEEAGDLAAWAALLHSPPADCFLPAVLCDRAHVAMLMEDAEGRDRAEKAALQAAAGSLADDALIRLARHAESRKQDEFSRRVWVEAIRKGTGPLPLGARLKPVIEELGVLKKEAELLDVLTTYRFLEPRNPVFVIQHAYLACLTGRITPAAVIREVAPLHADHPELLPARCVLALAHLLEGRADEALALTGSADPDWSGVNPAYRAIHGIALAKGGDPVEAARLLEDFPWEDLLPSERRILRGLAEISGESRPLR